MVYLFSVLDELHLDSIGSLKSHYNCLSHCEKGMFLWNASRIAKKFFNMSSIYAKQFLDDCNEIMKLCFKGLHHELIWRLESFRKQGSDISDDRFNRPSFLLWHSLSEGCFEVSNNYDRQPFGFTEKSLGHSWYSELFRSVSMMHTLHDEFPANLDSYPSLVISLYARCLGELGKSVADFKNYILDQFHVSEHLLMFALSIYKKLCADELPMRNCLAEINEYAGRDLFYCDHNVRSDSTFGCPFFRAIFANFFRTNPESVTSKYVSVDHLMYPDCN